MTKSKKSIVMHGMLLCPLVLGHCAFLRFQPLNSNYFLSMYPFPLAAASPLPTVLAACA